MKGALCSFGKQIPTHNFILIEQFHDFSVMQVVQAARVH